MKLCLLHNTIYIVHMVIHVKSWVKSWLGIIYAFTVTKLIWNCVFSTSCSLPALTSLRFGRDQSCLNTPGSWSKGLCLTRRLHVVDLNQSRKYESLIRSCNHQNKNAKRKTSALCKSRWWEWCCYGHTEVNENLSNKLIG